MDRTAEFIQKIGSFECDIVEANPVVWQNELYIFEYIRSIDDIGRQRCYFNNSITTKRLR